MRRREGDDQQNIDNVPENGGGEGGGKGEGGVQIAYAGNSCARHVHQGVLAFSRRKLRTDSSENAGANTYIRMTSVCSLLQGSRLRWGFRAKARVARRDCNLLISCD